MNPILISVFGALVIQALLWLRALDKCRERMDRVVESECECFGDEFLGSDPGPDEAGEPLYSRIFDAITIFGPGETVGRGRRPVHPAAGVGAIPLPAEPIPATFDGPLTDLIPMGGVGEEYQVNRDVPHSGAAGEICCSPSEAAGRGCYH